MSDVDASEDYVVKLPSGEARIMTIDEIDQAFEAGRIDRWTPILAPDASDWSNLAKLADLGDEAEAFWTASPEEPNSIAPTAVRLDDDLELDGVPRPRRVRRAAIAVAMACVLAGGLGVGAHALRRSRTSNDASSGAEAVAAAAVAPPAEASVAAPVPAPPRVPVTAATHDVVPAATAPASSGTAVKGAPKAKHTRGRRK
jgi:hypothetical protein